MQAFTSMQDYQLDYSPTVVLVSHSHPIFCHRCLRFTLTGRKQSGDQVPKGCVECRASGRQPTTNWYHSYMVAK